MDQEELIKSLSTIRSEIDDLDRQLVELLDQRAEKSIIIGKIKKELQLDLYSPEREDSVFNNITKQNSKFISEEGLRRIFKGILKESVILQESGQKKQPDE
jgi:chorismate mutase